MAIFGGLGILVAVGAFALVTSGCSDRSLPELPSLGGDQDDIEPDGDLDHEVEPDAEADADEYVDTENEISSDGDVVDGDEDIEEDIDTENVEEDADIDEEGEVEFDDEDVDADANAVESDDEITDGDMVDGDEDQIEADADADESEYESSGEYEAFHDCTIWASSSYGQSFGMRAGSMTRSFRTDSGWRDTIQFESADACEYPEEQLPDDCRRQTMEASTWPPPYGQSIPGYAADLIGRWELHVNALEEQITLNNFEKQNINGAEIFNPIDTAIIFPVTWDMDGDGYPDQISPQDFNELYVTAEQSISIYVDCEDDACSGFTGRLNMILQPGDVGYDESDPVRLNPNWPSSVVPSHITSLEITCRTE